MYQGLPTFSTVQRAYVVEETATARSDIYSCIKTLEGGGRGKKRKEEKEERKKRKRREKSELKGERESGQKSGLVTMLNQHYVSSSF